MKNFPVNMVRVFFYIWVLISIINISLEFQFMSAFTTFIGLVIVSSLNIITEMVFPTDQSLWDNRSTKLIINSVLVIIILEFILYSKPDKYLLILMVIPISELIRVFLTTEAVSSTDESA